MSIITQSNTDQDPLNLFRNVIKQANMDEKPHQIEGLKWILNNENSGNKPCNVRGGLVADEMGLGKTIQIIGCDYV